MTYSQFGRASAASCLFFCAAASSAPPAPAPAVAASEPFAMKPGLWETVVANETPGVDSRKTITSRACFQASDLASTQQALPRQYDFGSKCTIKDYKLAAGVASWSLSCTTKTGSLAGPGTLTYKAAEFSGTANLISKDGAKTTKVNQTFTGKRLGDCK